MGISHFTFKGLVLRVLLRPSEVADQRESTLSSTCSPDGSPVADMRAEGFPKAISKLAKLTFLTGRSYMRRRLSSRRPIAMYVSSAVDASFFSAFRHLSAAVQTTLADTRPGVKDAPHNFTLKGESDPG